MLLYQLPMNEIRPHLPLQPAAI